MTKVASGGRATAVLLALENLEADLASALKAGGLSREEFREELQDSEVLKRFRELRPTHPWAWEDREERAAAIEKIVQDPVKAGFLRAFAACGQITQACVKSGLAPRMLWRMIDDGSPDFDPVFAEAFANAESLRPAFLEDLVWQRVLNGNASDGLLAKLLESRRRDTYNRQPARTREVNQPKQIEAIDVAERRIALAREFNTVLKK